MKKSIQLFIINLLNNLGIKRLVKYTYYFTGYQVSKLIKKSVYSDSLLKEVGESKDETFFGYYDKSPESPDGNFIAYHSTRLPTFKDPDVKSSGVDIMIFNRNTHETTKVANTQAFNWQQGARLMWLSDNELVFNIYDGEYKSVLYDVNTKSTTTFHRPINDCFYKKYALTLNYKRLNAFSPDYGYRSHGNGDSLLDLEKDGIWKMDLQNHQIELIISLGRLKELNAQKSMSDAEHWVNHIMISPDGKRFLFFHRWKYQSKRYDRLLCYDLTTDNLEILADNGLVSHFFWINTTEVIGYMTDSDSKPKLMTVNLEKNVSQEFKYSQTGDIHMNIHKRRMLFDTYPDFYRLKTLGIADLDSGESELIGRIREPLKFYNGTRCDLHARFNYTGSRIYFDSVHYGKRKLYYIEKN